LKVIKAIIIIPRDSHIAKDSHRLLQDLFLPL